MRRRLTLLVAAVGVLVMVAFLVPLAVLVRTVAADRATALATADVQLLVTVVGTATPETVRLTVDQLAVDTGREVSVFLADGTVLGAPAPRTPAVTLAARGQSLSVESAAGREVVVAVQGRPEGTGVIRTLVPRAELTAGVTRAWLVLALLGALLVLVGLVVADRLAGTLVRPITALSAVSHRLANAELGRACRTGRAGRVARGGGRVEPPGRADPDSAARGARTGGRPVPPAAYPVDGTAAGGRVVARPGRRGPADRGGGRAGAGGDRGDPTGPVAQRHGGHRRGLRRGHRGRRAGDVLVGARGGHRPDRDARPRPRPAAGAAER